MRIIDLNAPEAKAKVLTDWLDRGLMPSDRESLEGDFVCDFSWNGVRDDAPAGEGKVVAVFEIRNVCDRYLKNMRVFFAPDVTISFEGLDYEQAKDEVDKLVTTLGMIFDHLLSTINGGTGHIKIYNDHPAVHLIFYSFAEHLKDRYPNDFQVAFYKNWIDIKMIQHGGNNEQPV